jgi:hypothetical protein
MKPPNLTELPNRKAIPACSNCGSSDVRTEAFAAWNGVTQGWHIVEMLDGNTVCAACGQSCEIKWRIAA